MAEIIKSTGFGKYGASDKSECGNNIDSTVFIKDAVI